jgi:hypothetical protein
MSKERVVGDLKLGCREMMWCGGGSPTRQASNFSHDALSRALPPTTCAHIEMRWLIFSRGSIN